MSKSIKQLQVSLEEFESRYWDAPKSEAEYLRHIVLHLGKLLGKTSTVCERREHSLNPDLKQLKEEVVPDLLYYSLALSNLYNIDLEEAFEQRLKDNSKRVKQWVERRDK